MKTHGRRAPNKRWEPPDQGLFVDVPLLNSCLPYDRFPSRPQSLNYWVGSVSLILAQRDVLARRGALVNNAKGIRG